MTNQKRRLFLKSTLATGAVVAAAGAGLLRPTAVLAAWPEKAFNATSIESAIADLYGSGTTTESADVELKAPEIAENGAVVPVTVKSTLSDADAIAIIIAGNGRPMAAELKLTPKSVPMFATRVKVAKSSKITAVVKQGDKLLSASRDVKVTVGGCGG